VSLLSRVSRLESKVKAPVKPVHLVFQQVGESDEKVVGRCWAARKNNEGMVIVVKFVKPNTN
jgi:hypothetical protein